MRSMKNLFRNTLVMGMLPVMAFSSPIPDKYEPFLRSYESCMIIFDQERRTICLEERINGLLALGLHRKGADGVDAMRQLATKECGAEKSTDTLLCQIRVIDFWIH